MQTIERSPDMHKMLNTQGRNSLYEKMFQQMNSIFTFIFILLTTLLYAQQSSKSTANSAATFGVFAEVTPPDSLFVTPPDEDFWVISTAPADYDNDGDLDIVVLGYYVVYNISVDYKLVLMRNDGPASPEEWEFSYTDVPFGELTSGSSDMAWGDVDADGDLDLVLGTDGTTVIYRNESGVLVLTDTELPGYWEDNSQADFDLRSITWADFDNDGDLDLLLPSIPDFNTFTYRTALMRNNGPNGTGGYIFTETDSVFAATKHAQSAWADYDGDGDLDLLLINIVPNAEEGFIRRYRNDGNGAFVGEDILGSLSVQHGEAQWGDYDGDGDLDILVAGNIRELDGTYTPMALRIYRNNNDNFVPEEVISDPASEGWFDLTAATWADYDSDGDMDILLAGNYNSGVEIEGRARIYTNTDGVFANSGTELPSPRAWGDRGGTFSWLDLDGDGDLDYFIAGQYFVTGGNGLVEAQMHVYRNDVEGQNNPPSTPTGLDAALLGDNTVRLSWTAAIDDHTPVLALTYDLDLFLDNVPVTIPDRLPEPGNVSAVSDWLLTGLPDGNYKWSIRTVDAAFIGSPVATGVFTIGTQTAIREDIDVLKNYSLEQNYPNPFTASTTIKFTLPEQENVVIILYDAQGSEIKTLVNKVFPQGVHTIKLTAEEFSAGFYLYRITAGKFTAVKQLQVL
jgi:hypothetical protein